MTPVRGDRVVRAIERAGFKVALGALLFGVLAAACGSGSASGPLVALTFPSGYCLPSDPNWGSPMGFTTDWYANRGQHPAVIKSLRLLAPHGLVLHGAVVYEMEHSQHVLYQANSWPDIGKGASSTLWARRQPIPGAVIPPGHAKGVLIRASKQDNLYVIVEDVSATTPAGGWALGEVVSYQSDGSTYTVEDHTGIAIASTTHSEAAADTKGCNESSAAFNQAFAKKS
jgi:hypothetical protein